MARIIGTAGTAPKARKPSRAPRRPPAVAAPHRAPISNSPVFGRLQRPDVKITRAVHTAQRRHAAAVQRAERNVVAPRIPRLPAGGTSVQRQATIDLVRRSLASQGYGAGTTREEARGLPPAARRALHRAVRLQALSTRNTEVRVGAAARAGVPPPLPRGFRYAPSGARVVEQRTRNPFTGATEWLPADTFANGPLGTRASLGRVHASDRALARAARQQARSQAVSLAGERRLLSGRMDRIYSKLSGNPRAMHSALLAVERDFGAHPASRHDLAVEGRQVGAALRSQAKPYNPPKVNVAGIDVTQLTTLGGKIADKLYGGNAPDLATAAFNDIVGFPVGAVQAGAAIARAAHEVLGPAALLTPFAPLAVGDFLLRPGSGLGGGNFKTAAALADSFTRGPTGELLIHGDPAAALRSFQQHPIYALGDVAGAYGAAGRVAGAAGRLGMTAGRLAGAADSSALMRASRALGDTSRESLRLFPGSPQEVSRSYSKNAFTKGLQVYGERRAVRAGEDPRVIAQHGPIRDRIHGQTSALRAQVHEFASTEGEGVRRRGQQEVAHDLVRLVGRTAAGRVSRSLGKAGSAVAVAVIRRARHEADAGPVVDEVFRLEGKKLNRAARDVIAAMVERRVIAGDSPEAFRADLRREATRLAQEAEVSRHTWSGVERKLNRLQRRALLKAADDPAVYRNGARLTSVADHIVGMSTTIEEGLIRAGVLDRRQALISKIRPLAVSRFGHRAMTPADRARLEAERTARVDTYVGLRRQIEETQQALARAHAKGHEGKVAELQTHLDQTRARLADHQTALAADELAHAQAVHEHGSASRAVDAARKRVTRAERKQAKAIGGEQVRRGQAQARGERLAGQSRSRKKAEGELTAAKAARDTATERLKTATGALDGRSLRDFNMGLIDRHGAPVTTEDVVAQMQREGIAMPGYIRQARGREAESFYRNWFRPGRRSRLAQRRSGVATERGGYASDWHSLAESVLRRRGDLDSVQTWDRFVHRFGLVKEDGQMLTPREVQPWLEQHGFLDHEGNPVPGAPDLVAVWALPKAADRSVVEPLQNPRPLDATVGARQLAAPRDAMNKGLGQQHGLVTRAMEHDVLGPADELRPGGTLADMLKPMKGEEANRRIVLMPAEQLRAFREHQQTGSTTAGKLGAALTNTFRGTVLPFSTKWLTGNVLEAFVRLAVAGARVDDMWRGHLILRELKKVDEEAYAMLKTRSLGGLFYASAERLKVYSGAERFQHTSLEGVARTLETLGTPRALIDSMSGPELMAHAAAFLPRSMFTGLSALGHGVFRLNRWFETESQMVALGRYGRERGQEFSQSWFKALTMQRQALEQVVQGLTETPEQIRFARYVDETLGKYARFSPQTRRIIQTVAPFLPWYLNSLRFVLHTLPAKHPVLTSLIAHTEVAMQPDMQKMRADVPPGDLQAALPVGPGRYLVLSRYTPFGAFTSGLDVVTDPVLPQILTSFGILKYGVNFTGRPLDIGNRDQQGRNIPGGKRALMALSSQLEALLPFAQIARRLQEHGETAYDDSYLWAPHTKSGTAIGGNDLGDAMTRIFNPFRPVALRPRAGTSGGAATSLRGLSPAEQRAIQNEARGLARQQSSPSSRREDRAIEDEARRLLMAGSR